MAKILEWAMSNKIVNYSDTGRSGAKSTLAKFGQNVGKSRDLPDMPLSDMLRFGYPGNRLHSSTKH